MPVVWRAKALTDVDRIVHYVAADRSAAARQVARELLLAGDSLAMFPRRGRPGRLAGTRELLAVTPYVLVYRMSDEDDVTILRVWHTVQDRPNLT